MFSSRDTDLVIAFVPILEASVAQWIEHQTSNLGVAGSSPAVGKTKCFASYGVRTHASYENGA